MFALACVLRVGAGGEVREGLHNEVLCSGQTVEGGKFWWEGGLQGSKSRLENKDVDVHLNNMRTHTRMHANRQRETSATNFMTRIAQSPNLEQPVQVGRLKGTLTPTSFNKQAEHF